MSGPPFHPTKRGKARAPMVPRGTVVPPASSRSDGAAARAAKRAAERLVFELLQGRSFLFAAFRIDEKSGNIILDWRSSNFDVRHFGESLDLFSRALTNEAKRVAQRLGIDIDSTQNSEPTDETQNGNA